MKDDDLAKRITNLEQNIKSLKTSQKLGSGSGVVLPVFTVNISQTISSSASGAAKAYAFVFTSESTFKPIITPYLGETWNGSSSSYYSLSYDYSVLQQYGSVSGFDISNPKQTIVVLIPFNMSHDFAPPSSGTINITGMIYANCRGIIKQVTL